MERPVLLYDGDCGLCTRSVAWVVARDRGGRVGLLPSSTEEAQALLASSGRGGVEQSTIVLVGRGGRAHLRSAAVVRTLWALGGRWRGAAFLLWLVPWPLRELAYRGVARFRHRLGPGTCRVG